MRRLDDWPEVFESIEPLPGGLRALRERIEREKRRAWLLWLTPAVAAAVVLMLWLRRDPPPPPEPPAALVSGASALPHPSAIALGLAEHDRPADGAVVFRWVDSSQPPAGPVYVEAAEVGSLEAAPRQVAVVDLP